MKEYRLEGPFKNEQTGDEDNIDFVIEAGPITGDASFDHAFGTEKRTGMLSVDIDGLVVLIEMSEDGTELSEREIQQGEFTEKYPSAYVKLSDEIQDDFNNGAFDE